MPEDITQIKLKFSCQENWDDMRPVDGGKFCNKCQKKVYDFTDSNTDEFRRIMTENPGSCGKYKIDQVDYAPATLPRWKQWVSAALVLIGFNLADNKAIAQVLSPKDTTQKVANKYDKEVVFGGGGEDASFPGGEVGLSQFINKNLQYTGNLTGRILMQFMIENDGSVSNIHVVRGLDETANNEALRVLALMPKWKPGIQSNGQPSRQQYTVPIAWAPVK